MSQHRIRDARVALEKAWDEGSELPEECAPDFDPDFCEFCGRTDGSHHDECER